ncbi:hypothetical protein MKW92_005590 [Papaver armeniacum]|nr:hypothetical protein MKW92_005590 [Papaver armeniacum]
MLGNCYPSFNLVLYDQIDCKRWFSCLFSFRSSNELQDDPPNNTSSNASLADSISKSGSSNDSRKVSREDIELSLIERCLQFYMNRDGWSRSPYRSRSPVYRRRRSLSRDYEIQTNGVGSETNRDDYPSQRIRGRRSPVRHTPEREEVKFSDQEYKHWILCDVDHKIL